MIHPPIVRVMEEEWDYLIVLDACRYDYFAKSYSPYFVGDLTKRRSVGTCTPEWCQKSFTQYYTDVVYISGTSFINSQDVLKGFKVLQGFDARKHFCHIIDVWDTGWNRELGGVLPEVMNEYAVSSLAQFPGKRFIIHYLQPHEPYISQRFSQAIDSFNCTSSNGLRWINEIRRGRRRPFERLLKLVFVDTKLLKNTWKIREFLNLPPLRPMEAVTRTYGVEGLRKAYEENLQLVLGCAAELCESLFDHHPQSRIVITSDHGELLGENGEYGHLLGQKSTNPILHDIPFFRIKQVKRKNIHTQTRTRNQWREDLLNQEEDIIQKLHALGYI